MRRLLLAGVVVLIYPITTAQPAVTCLLAIIAIVIVLWWQPYAALMDTRIYVLGSIIVLFSVLLSVVVKVQDSTDLTRQDA
jgi:hypothetical protein